MNDENEFGKLAVFASLVFVIACASPQPPPPKVQPPPLVAPIISHEAAWGCEGEHDRIYLPNVDIDAYPGLPPKVEPEHIILHFSNGTTLWAKPQYGSEDCANYVNCHRAIVILNPAWNQCFPQGILYEVATEDGKLLFESSSWEITQRATNASVHVGFACEKGFAGADLAKVSNESVANAGCLYQSSVSPQTGMTLTATAIGLAGTYFTYRAAYGRTVNCVANQSSNDTWTTNCY